MPLVKSEQCSFTLYSSSDINKYVLELLDTKNIMFGTKKYTLESVQ